MPLAFLQGVIVGWGTLQTQRSPVGRAGSARTRTRTRTRTHSLPASPADGDARPSGVCSARRAVPFSCRHRCPRQPGPPRRARARGGRCARLSSPPRHAEDPCSQGRGSRNCTHSQQPICSPRPHGSPRIHHPRPWEAPDLVSQGPVRSPLAASWLRAGNRAATGGPTPAIAGHSSTPPTAETPLLSASPWPLRGLSVASPWPPRARCPALLQPRAPDPEPRAGKALWLVPTVVSVTFPGSELFRLLSQAHAHRQALALACTCLLTLGPPHTRAHLQVCTHSRGSGKAASPPPRGGGSCTGGSHILRPPPVAPREPSSPCHLNKGVEKRSPEASVRICRRSFCGHNQYHRLRG